MHTRHFFDVNGAVGDAEQIKGGDILQDCALCHIRHRKKGDNAPGCAADQVLLAADTLPDRPYPCGERNLFPVGGFLRTERVLHEQAPGAVFAGCA